jgi:hypothetical protein
MTAQEKTVEIGSASLTGVRGHVAKSAAKPIARRTSLTRGQVEAIIGFQILAYGIYQVVRPLVGRSPHDLSLVAQLFRRAGDHRGA